VDPEGSGADLSFDGVGEENPAAGGRHLNIANFRFLIAD
jgi:hypothetical protein